jgi:F-type H+-transporting ATPase subunit b
MKNQKLVQTLLVFLMAATFPLLAAEGGYDYGKLVFKTINVALFFGGLYYLLKNPVGGFFSRRVKDIQVALEKAEKSRGEAKVRLDEIESKMANLDAELAEIEAKAKAELEREKVQLEAQAKEDAERIMEQAKDEIEHLHREAVLNLKAYVVDMALESAEKQIRDTMSEDERKKLFIEFTSRLGAKS